MIQCVCGNTIKLKLGFYVRNRLDVIVNKVFSNRMPKKLLIILFGVLLFGNVVQCSRDL